MAAELEVRAWQVADEEGCCLIYAKTRSAAKWQGAQKLGRDFKGLKVRRAAERDHASNQLRDRVEPFEWTSDLPTTDDAFEGLKAEWEFMPTETPRLPWWRRLLTWAGRIVSSGRRSPERVG